MSKYIVDIHGEIEGDYEIIEKYQEPKIGHWARVFGGSLIDDYRCDICQSHPPKKAINITWGWDFTNYCPNCEAEMESEND